MFWIEMHQGEFHTSKGWRLGEAVSAPSRAKDGRRFAYWELALQMKAGDAVFHICGKSVTSRFVGTSIVDVDGYSTERELRPEERWGWSGNYYRVPLKDFIAIDEISVYGVFEARRDELIDYFVQNRRRPPRDRKLLFFAVVDGELRLQQGGYISQVDAELFDILFGKLVASAPHPTKCANTGEHLAQIAVRIGQEQFAAAVRCNYREACCFPDCDVEGKSLLTAARIARWADAQDLRGNTSNGLCLCPMHDRLFELGYFTLNRKHEVCIHRSRAHQSSWARKHLLPADGKPIKLGSIEPSADALCYHWDRIGCWPDREHEGLFE